jgi:uncharacterized membrane protein YdcZ (DUF606 family)
MSERTVTILVWTLIGGLGGAVLVTSRRLRTRVPGLGDLVTVVAGRPAGRAVLVVAWMWLGWHAFAR